MKDGGIWEGKWDSVEGAKRMWALGTTRRESTRC